MEPTAPAANRGCDSDPMSQKNQSETGSIRCGNATIEYVIRRSTRRKKTITVTVDRDGVVIATPRIVTDDEVREFVVAKASWILQRLEECSAEPTRFVSGEALPYMGCDLTLIVELTDVEAPQVFFDKGCLRVTMTADLSENERRQVARNALITWFRDRAAERLPAAVERWSEQLGHVLSPPVLVRDQRKRWGSCASDHVIRLNWRVVMLDRSLIDYIVVHELSHLLIRNHSPSFWKLVARSIPDVKERHRQLREIGMRLPL